MSAFPKRILLATDGSEDAALAGRVAADISAGTGSELFLVHVWRTIPATRFESYIRTGLEDEAREILREQEERIEVYAQQAVTQTVTQPVAQAVAGAYLREGAPVDEILDLAGDLGAGLVVVGSRGHGTIERLLLGSVSEGIVHHARVPVLVVRGGEAAWPPERVVIGDDGSPDAREVGRLAATIGGLCNARAVMVRAYPQLPETDDEGRRFDARRVDDELHRQEMSLEDRARDLREATGLKPRVRISVGDPAEAVLETARENAEERTLVAVGSRGLGTVGRARLGSVSTKVLRAAKGPVLIHPHQNPV